MCFQQFGISDCSFHWNFGVRRLQLESTIHRHAATAMRRAQKYPAPVAGTVPTNVPTMYPWQGKMGENGEKWGKMGENGEKWGGNGEKWGKIRELGWCNWSPFPPFPPHFLPISPHFPPFSPIFPRELSPFSPIFPRGLSPMRTPPTALLPT